MADVPPRHRVFDRTSLIALVSSLAALSAVQTTFLAPIIWRSLRPEVEQLIEQHNQRPYHHGAASRDVMDGRFAVIAEQIRRIELLERRIEAIENARNRERGRTVGEER